MATESLISLDSHPSPTLVSLTFLHAGEGQSVLAHELTGERAGLMFDAEAYEAQLRGADGEVHVSVPVRSQSCRSDRSLMLYHLFHCTLITKQRKELGLRARGPVRGLCLGFATVCCSKLDINFEAVLLLSCCFC